MVLWQTEWWRTNRYGGTPEHTHRREKEKRREEKRREEKRREEKRREEKRREEKKRERDVTNFLSQGQNL